MSTTDAILICNATKHFRRTTIAKSHSTFKTEFLKWLRGERQPPQVTWIEVLRGINLRIAKGKTVGIIGRNGAGKSTLLKLITGIYSPASGTIEVNGRISALLELGAGFHPDFSGRENILINSIILGMSRSDVKERMAGIIEFSELGEFIDQPVRTYSSGMYTRLAFSVATHVDPDILIIDEILAVGDEHFLRKSRAKMDEFKEVGKTIVLVTHGLRTVEEWCDQAVWIDGGVIRRIGDPKEVVAEYIEAVRMEEQSQGGPSAPAMTPTRAGSTQPAKEIATSPRLPSDPNVPRGDAPVRLEQIRLLNRDGLEISKVTPDERLDICVDYTAAEGRPEFGFEISLFNESGQLLYNIDTFGDADVRPEPPPRVGTARLILERVGLGGGTYTIAVVARSRAGKIFERTPVVSLTVQSPGSRRGLAMPPHRWSVEATPIGIGRAS